MGRGGGGSARMGGGGRGGEGGDPPRRHDGPRDLRAADGRQAYAGALSRGGLSVLARPRAEGVDPQPLRCDGNFALLPRIRTGAAALSLAALSRWRSAWPARASGPRKRAVTPYGAAHAGLLSWQAVQSTEQQRVQPQTLAATLETSRSFVACWSWVS